MTPVSSPRPSPCRLRRRAGYTLIELLVVITGTTALISLGATTIVTVRRVTVTAQTAAESGAALSRLHRTLREDAADARSATADDAGLTFTADDGAAIRYEADGPAVRRTVTGPRTGRDRFPVGGAGFEWSAENRPGGVRVAVGYDAAGGADERADGAAVELAAWLPTGPDSMGADTTGEGTE
ncbi:PulJ/GspJ family protein [Alienimonas californiensis]|uniref:Prepilin-type N-terminal cleavage/methylation domain-containing protein n=1 Tax=Alienimonas californiensis TaxID=2527989 RepID=A0A517P984_9PLAN|nr:type II secretion system protein [Alienimonas californiensis]QDT15932.1 hypothetical protein CA12_20300 [Alienimonas californiensis]